MSDQPLVSIVLIVKNGMPYLPAAIASLETQTYQNFELIVQDAVSTDGTLEYLNSIESLPAIKIESMPDGEQHPLNRAIARSSGNILGSLDDDNLLESDALATVVNLFAQHPHQAVVYGAAKLIDERSTTTNVFEPADFDLLDVMACKLVPPYAVSFFSKAICEKPMQIATTNWACYDYRLWLQLSHLPILRVPAVLGSIRISQESNTCRSDMYDEICDTKIVILKEFLSQFEPSPLVKTLERHGVAGIYTWAAESMLWIPSGSQEGFDRYYEKAYAVYPESDRLKRLKLEQTIHQLETELNETRYQLGDTTNKLEDTQVKLEDVRLRLEEAQSIREQFQQEVVRLNTIIQAMESSKFWKLRNQWVDLQQRLTQKAGK